MSVPAPTPTRAEQLRIRANDAAVWFAVQVIPAPMVAWLIHQRCLGRRRIQRQLRRRGGSSAR